VANVPYQQDLWRWGGSVPGGTLTADMSREMNQVTHMDAQDYGGSGRLVDLTETECWTLARTRPVGRLAWSGPGGLTVVPVNFSLDGETVIVRTAAYSAIGRECDDCAVAFQIDELDERMRSGWSVQMRGWAHVDHGQVGGPEPQVWPSGAKTLRLRITVTEVSGRRLVPASNA